MGVRGCEKGKKAKGGRREPKGGEAIEGGRVVDALMACTCFRSIVIPWSHSAADYADNGTHTRTRAHAHLFSPLVKHHPPPAQPCSRPASTAPKPAGEPPPLRHTPSRGLRKVSLEARAYDSVGVCRSVELRAGAGESGDPTHGITARVPKDSLCPDPHQTRPSHLPPLPNFSIPTQATTSQSRTRRHDGRGCQTSRPPPSTRPS